MRTNRIAHFQRRSLPRSVPEDEPPRLVELPARSRGRFLAWSAVFRAFQRLILALIGGFFVVSVADSAWRVVSLAAALALAALAGSAWYLSRVRAKRRWRAALDVYAATAASEED